MKKILFVFIAIFCSYSMAFAIPGSPPGSGSGISDIVEDTTPQLGGNLDPNGHTITGYQVEPSEGAFANGDKTKLDGIETSADVTDATNVASAGALMTAGGTLTGELTVDENGIEFQETDTLTDCSTFSITGGGIFYDDSEGVFKKCQDNVMSDLDSTANAFTSSANFTAGAYEADLTALTSLSLPAFTSGTLSIANTGSLSQGPTTAAQYYTGMSGYDVGGTSHISLLRTYAHASAPYIELGPTTNNIKVDDTGAVTLQGTSVQISGPATNSKSGAYTIGTDDTRECYGGVIYVTSAATITACDGLDDNMAFTVITIGAIAVSVDTQSDDLMYLDGTALDDGDKATNTSTTGDMIVCTYYSASGWYCASGSPDGDHWTDGGP